MGIVSDGDAHRAAFEAIAFDEGFADVSGHLMPFDDDHLEEVGSFKNDIAIFGSDFHDGLTCHDSARFGGHDAGFLGFEFDLEVVGSEILHVDGVLDEVWEISLAGVEERFAIFGDELAIFEDHLGVEVFEVIHDDEVGEIERCDGASITETVAFGVVEGADSDGGDWVKASFDDSSKGVIEVAVLLDLSSVLIVGAKDDAAIVPWSDGFDEIHASCVGTNAEMGVNAFGDLLFHLIDGD